MCNRFISYGDVQWGVVNCVEVAMGGYSTERASLTLRPRMEGSDDYVTPYCRGRVKSVTVVTP